MTLKYGLGRRRRRQRASSVTARRPAEKRRLLHEFAAAAAPLLRPARYVPIPPGTTASDIRDMMQTAASRSAPDWRANRSGSTPPAGARDCDRVADRSASSLAGARRDRRLRKVSRSPSCRRARRSWRSRPRAVRDDPTTDVARLARRVRDVGSRVVDEEPDRIERAAPSSAVDILFPCACSQHPRRQCRTRRRRGDLRRRQRSCEPRRRSAARARRRYPSDFLSNCGGVLGGTLEFAGVPFARIGALIEERPCTRRCGRACRCAGSPRPRHSHAMRSHRRAPSIPI